MFFVHGGKVKLTVLSREGKQAVIALVGPGNFFGDDDPEFSEMFVRYLLSRNIRIEEDLVDQLQLQRETARADPPVAGQLRKGGAAGTRLLAEELSLHRRPL